MAEPGVTESTESEKQTGGLKDVLLRLDREIGGAAGAKRTVTEKEGKTITTVVIEKPGSYDETPERFILQKTVPKKKSEPTTTILTHTWRMKNEGVDIENHSEQIEFATKSGFLGFGSVTTITKAEKGFTGTKTIYADSNTPRFSYKKLDRPVEVVDKILRQIKG